MAKFDDSAVNFGDPNAPAPLSLSCSDAQAIQGSGRWISDREWAFEFERDLPPGIACSLQLRSGIKSASSAYLTGATSYKFNSVWPFMQNIRAYDGSRIDEEQFFILQLNGAATLASVRANMWCAVDGLGERVAVRLIEDQDPVALLKSQGLERTAEKAPLSFVTLACNRRLSAMRRLHLMDELHFTTRSGYWEQLLQSGRSSNQILQTGRSTCEIEFRPCPALEPLSFAKGRYTEVNFRLFDRRQRVVDIGQPSATCRRSRPAASGRINIGTAILDAPAI